MTSAGPLPAPAPTLTSPPFHPRGRGRRLRACGASGPTRASHPPLPAPLRRKPPGPPPVGPVGCYPAGPAHGQGKYTPSARAVDPGPAGPDPADGLVVGRRAGHGGGLADDGPAGLIAWMQCAVSGCCWAECAAGPTGKRVICDRTSFCRWAIYVTCLPAWVGCLVKVPSTGRTAFACYPPLPLDRDCEARVDPDITGTGTGPTTSESTPPTHATRATRPALYLST